MVRSSRAASSVSWRSAAVVAAAFIISQAGCHPVRGRSASISRRMRSPSASDGMRRWPISVSCAETRSICPSTSTRSMSALASRHRTPMATMRPFCARWHGSCAPAAGSSMRITAPRHKVHRLEQLAHAAGLRGELRDITPNVVSACELDAERRQGIIRSGVPWYHRILFREASSAIRAYRERHLPALPHRPSHIFPDLHDAPGLCLSGACSLKEPRGIGAGRASPCSCVSPGSRSTSRWPCATSSQD